MAPQVGVSREGGELSFDGIESSKKIAISFRTRSGNAVRIVLLSQEQARNIWKTSYGDQEYVFSTPADVFFDESSVHLRARNTRDLHFGVFPGLRLKAEGGMPLRKSTDDGIFSGYATDVKARKQTADLRPVQTMQSPCELQMGKPVAWRNDVAVAVPPRNCSHSDIWRLVLTEDTLAGLSDAFLRISYTGDIGRLYAGKRLLDDDFYNGAVWEVGLKRFSAILADGALEIKVQPLRRNMPIYLPQNAWPDFDASEAVGNILSLELQGEYEASFAVESPEK
jgi:beta-galactosidase